jgi:wyosine [tRNA(Phe)-imidazoG37] synthetase (radical SAM superfamily)
MAYLFGPVPSRRLGRSLGVDLVPRKTCPYNCIYCEVGPTTRRTLRRTEFHTEAILRELESYLARPGAPPDFITLAGSGEPTLNLGLARIIAGIKQLTATPVAVLTNGALLYLPAVREALADADVVLPSLDAARTHTFRIINRPHPSLSLERVLGGLENFRQEHRGPIWLEIMLLKGINDGEDELKALKQAIKKIAPDKVQLNTAVRPVVKNLAQPLGPEEMAAVAAFLGHGAEVIAEFRRSPEAPVMPRDETFLEMLARRPMVARDLAETLGMPLSLVESCLRRLKIAGLIQEDRYLDQEFYRSFSPASPGEPGPQKPDASLPGRAGPEKSSI